MKINAETFVRHMVNNNENKDRNKQNANENQDKRKRKMLRKYKQL